MRKRERFLRQSRMALAAAVVGLGATSAFADINFSLQPTLIDGAAVPAGTEQVLVTGAGQDVRFGLNVTVLGADPKLYSLSGTVTTPGADLKGDLGATSSKDYLYANPNPPGGLEIKTIDLISTDAFKGIGSGVGTIKDADGDGDMDLGVVTTPQDSRAWMRTNGTVLTTKIVNGEEVQVYGPAPATGGVAVAGGMQWTAADVKFTSGALPTLASGQATTNVVYTPPTGADAKYAGLWSEDGTTVLDGASAGAVVGGPASAGMITGPDITISKNTAANIGTGANYQAASVAIADGMSLTQLGEGTLVANTLTLGAGSKLALDKGNLMTTGDVLAVRAAIKSGYNGGTWDGAGIVTAKGAGDAGRFALGYAAGDDANLTTKTDGTFGGVPFGPTSVLVKQTIRGDADLDGDVDGDDVTIWALNFTGELFDPATPGTLWTTGDWDYDGDTDGDDVTVWALNFSGELFQPLDIPGASPQAVQILSAMGIQVVPEPSSLAVLALGSLLAVRRRR